MSIVEIAQMAGVSVASVSYYFNRPERVGKETAGRIREAIEKSNYQVKVRRPGPKTREQIGIKTGCVVFLSLTGVSPQQMMQLPVIPQLLGSIQAALNERRLHLLLAGIGADGEIPSCVFSRFCDGVILFGDSGNPKVINALKERLNNLPAVWCFRSHNDPENTIDHIFYANRYVGGMAADYLFRKGHRQVGVFNAAAGHSAFKERVVCFLQRAAELGMTATEFTVAPGVGIMEWEREALGQYLAGQFACPEFLNITGAFFCADDMIPGVYGDLLGTPYCLSRLTLIGCNADERALRFIKPRPATIDIKVEKIGQLSVERLLACINGSCKASGTETFIRPEIVDGAK